MLIADITWKPEYALGVDIVDNAHRELFSIVQRLYKIVKEEQKNEWASEQGIKYFKTYAMRHFEEEEEYMRSIGYEGYEEHRKLHAALRDELLPKLEKDLRGSEYSNEAVRQFLKACTLWLTKHIMGHDLAIKPGSTRG